LDALVVTSLNKIHCPRVTAVVRSIARNNPKHRPIIARHDGIVDTLADILHTSRVLATSHDKQNNDNDDEIVARQNRKTIYNVSERINAIHAIAHLVNSNDETRTFLCGRPTLLTAIVLATQENDTQDMAVRALERLATVSSNRYVLAHCNGLIVAVAEAVEREALREKQRNNAIQAGQVFVENRCDDDDICSTDDRTDHNGSNGTSCYLAKPLLMSLLVAM
jgi:hypothetical protein